MVMTDMIHITDGTILGIAVIGRHIVGEWVGDGTIHGITDIMIHGITAAGVCMLAGMIHGIMVAGDGDVLIMPVVTPIVGIR